MRENEFRDRLRDALGEPPPLASPRLGPPDAALRRTYPRAMVAIAIVLAVLLVAVLVASRIALRPLATTVPGGKGAAQFAPDSFPCSLAVAMVIDASNRGQSPLMTKTMGFLNIPSGDFRVDPKATVSDLPPSGGLGPTYSAQLKRWIAALPPMISPDGRSYAWVISLPQDAASYSQYTSAELHVYDVEKKVDRKVWSQPQSIGMIRWDASGILVSTVPFKGGPLLYWRIDPASGKATQAPNDSDLRHLPLGMLPPGNRNYSTMGTDSHGNTLFRIGSRDPGTRYSVMVGSASGKFTTLYEGAQGDGTNFDPQGMTSDDHGIWMGNADGSRVWLWNESSGLKDFKVTNTPPAPAGYDYTSTFFYPSGPCVPGVFKGVAPTGLPKAPTPSPSPTPPVIDWSTLTSKPLQLDQLVAGSPCPVSSSKDIPVKGQSGKWPNYGFGNGPAYLSGQFSWYSNGGQGALILVDPQYTGPLLVRSKRLDGAASLTFGGEGLTTVGDRVYGLPQTASPPYWGTWFGFLTTDAPGCYGIQFDGTNFSAVVVISVKKGPPPPA